METEAQIVLEATPEPAVEAGPNRVLPFSFAKRHGVLIRGITEESADTVCRPGVSAMSIAEVQRFICQAEGTHKAGNDHQQG